MNIISYATPNTFAHMEIRAILCSDPPLNISVPYSSLHGWHNGQNHHCSKARESSGAVLKKFPFLLGGKRSLQTRAPELMLLKRWGE